MPQQRAGEGGVRAQPQPPACARGHADLLLGPFGALGGLAVELGRRENVEQFVIGRMDRDELALEVRRELADRDAGLGADAGDLVAIILAVGGALEVDQPAVPRRHLDPDIAQVRRPFRHRRQAVERRPVAHELRQKMAGPFIAYLP